MTVHVTARRVRRLVGAGLWHPRAADDGVPALLALPLRPPGPALQGCYARAGRRLQGEVARTLPALAELWAHAWSLSSKGDPRTQLVGGRLHGHGRGAARADGRAPRVLSGGQGGSVSSGGGRGGGKTISCQVGKGRDMGFLSILNFFVKLSKGTARMTTTRQAHRLAVRLSLTL